MPTTYCTSTHVEFVLSEAGVVSRVDDDESGVASVAEEGAVTTAINWAAAEINTAVGKQYRISEVTNNTALQMANAYLAAERLCLRRGNDVPAGLVADCEKIRTKLADIRYGREQLPEQADSFETYPTVSNFTPSLGSLNGSIFVNPYSSTNSPPATGINRVYPTWAWHWGWWA